MSNLIEEFEALKTDVEKWKFVIEHKDSLVIHLDNDGTFIRLRTNDEEWAAFDGYIGWSDGVFSLLKAIGVKAESV